MNERNYILLTATIFVAVAFLHFMRLFAHWSVQIGTLTFPVWGSWLGLFVGAALGIWAFRLLSQTKASHP